MRKIENLNKAMQLIFYIVWILLGILLFGVIIYLVAANPMAKLGQVGGGPGGDFPSQEMMRQYTQQGGQAGQFPSPSGKPDNQQPGGQQPR